MITAGLKPPKFFSLPVGSIKPEGKAILDFQHYTSLISRVYNILLLLCTIIHVGWVKQQLQIQADGLSGHLPLFWPDVENSSWIGGKADSGLHERAPYWLNG